MNKKITIIEPGKTIIDRTNFSKQYDRYTKKSVHGYVIVRAYDRDGNLKWTDENHNLVVTVGRSWLMQKAFDVNYSSSNPQKHMFLSWFSVGSGGTASGSPGTPIAPNDSDTDLFNRVKFGTDTSVYADGGYKKGISSLTYTDNVTAQLMLVLDYNEGNDDGYINEIGLFASNSSDPASATDFVMFSHATFGYHAKDTATQLTFEWIYLF